MTFFNLFKSDKSMPRHHFDIALLYLKQPILAYSLILINNVNRICSSCNHVVVQSAWC